MQKTGHKEEMIRRKRADKGNWKKHSWQCLTPEQSQPRKPPVADLGEEGARQEVIPEVREDKEVGASAEQVEITTQTSAIAAGSVDTGKLIVQRTQGQGLHSARLTERRGGRGGPQRCTASPQESSTSHTGESCTSLTSHCDPASPETRRLGAHQGSQEKALEAETLHGSLPSTPDHRDGGESGRKSNVGPR
ncbi:uncharacterized protein LOC130190746 isoform X5 [Pseudoliparis swirei]|uniref:uncharacterized protein LOC130190746 isoform X5 n=1 Tax=Pseudoliparis swirei TaxID=2059687 RepID=UPI0024BDE569|nr:uncharacterized protein LOC130190746 isoform X5 [Pseudoliparis swirei]